jgi:hypothetical protein
MYLWIFPMSCCLFLGPLHCFQKKKILGILSNLLKFFLGGDITGDLFLENILGALYILLLFNGIFCICLLNLLVYSVVQFRCFPCWFLVCLLLEWGIEVFYNNVLFFSLQSCQVSLYILVLYIFKNCYIFLLSWLLVILSHLFYR